MSEAINYVPGEWYEAKTREELEAFFASRIPAIREAAREQGYAIGLHGSMRRDLDLIAVPWREGASDKDVLAHAIAVAACGITRDGDHQWEVKPLGRLATSLPCCWPSWYGEAGAGHIDLSVMAPQPAPTPHPAVPVVSDEQIDPLVQKHARATWSGSQQDWDVAEFSRLGLVMFANAILALRPAVEPMTPEQMRKAAMDEMSKIPALANHHSWKGWPGTWAFATAAVNGIAAKAEGGA